MAANTIPSNDATPLASELTMLRRLIGTEDPTGRAEMRGIVERAERDAAAMLAALKLALPFIQEHMQKNPYLADPGKSVLAAIAAAEGRS